MSERPFPYMPPTPPRRSKHRGALRTDFTVRLINAWLDRYSDTLMEAMKLQKNQMRSLGDEFMRAWSSP